MSSGEAARIPYSAAFGIPVDRVLALGTPRTDFFFDPVAMAAARERVHALYPDLAGRRVVLHAPTFRGRGRSKRAATGIDAARLRAALPAEYILALKTHPNLDPAATWTAGYDVVIDRSFEINEIFTVTDILITDFSSSVFEFALLKRPIIVLTDDLEAYERDPGLYLDPRTELIGAQVSGTDAVAEAILQDAFDLEPYDAFIRRHLGACDGSTSDRLVDRFVGADAI